MDAPDNLLGVGLSGLSIRIFTSLDPPDNIFVDDNEFSLFLHIWHISYKITLVLELRLGAYSIKTNLI